MSTQSILVIDDCDNFRMIICDMLLDAGYIVEEASCPHDAFDKIRREKFDLILCDLHMPFINGEQNRDYQTSYQVGIMTIRELQGLFPATPVIALTATDQSDLERIKSALRGITAFTKPGSRSELFKIVQHASKMADHYQNMQ